MKKILSIIFGVLALVGVAAFFIIPGWYVGGAIFFAFSIIVAIVMGLRKKFETKCSKCKKAYDYENDVEWKLIKKWTKGQPDTSNTLVRSYFQYDITCHCSECGNKKRYRKKIEGPSLNNKLEVKAVDPEYVLEQNFDQDQEVTWGVVFTSLLAAVVFLVGGIGGGLLFSGRLGEILDNADIDIPGITEVDKGEDPADYYGTYYYIESSQLKTVEFKESACIITKMNGRDTESETYPYEYVSSEYASTRLASPEYNDLDAILAYVNSDKSQCIIFWVKGNDNGKYTFITADGAVATETVLTFADVTNDPQDYYGTYTYGTLYVTLNEDGSAKMDLGEGEGIYSYMYADRNYLQTWFNSNYNSAIVIFEKNSNGAYIFNYSGNELILQDTYNFTK